MFRLVRQALGKSQRAEVLFECRHRGTGVTRDMTTCPACGRPAIVRYEI
jgi:hypothetical protein